MAGSRGDSITLAPELVRVFAALRRLPLHEQAYAAGRLLPELAGAATALRRQRRAAIMAMHDDDGLSFRTIAGLVGMSYGGVRDLYENRGPWVQEGRTGGGSSSRSRSTAPA